MDKKDYYQILGITEEEKKLKGSDFEKVIKPKYKKLCVKYHPDKWTNGTEQEKKDAEEKFKEIAEAYSVLSDSTKREQYDNPMSGFKFSGFGDFNPFDIMDSFGFGNFGGFGRQNNKNTIKKGQSLRMMVEISLEEAYSGVNKKIKYNAYETCDNCNGTGSDKDSTVETCPHCGGTGTIFSQNGYVQTITTCQHCGGKGTWIKNPCSKCGGNGVVQKSREIDIKIPKGVDDGYAFEITGGGHAPIQSNGKGVNGDLLIVIKVKEHDKFIRQGDNLMVQIEVPVLDAITGSKIEVDTINGTKLSCNIPKCVYDGFGLRFAEKGMPNIHNGKFGDMIGIIKIKMPKTISSEECDKINELKKSDNFK